MGYRWSWLPSPGFVGPLPYVSAESAGLLQIVAVYMTSRSMTKVAEIRRTCTTPPTRARELVLAGRIFNFFYPAY